LIEILLEAERALSFGRIDRAEELYRQVAAGDPRNSIAVVGLARVALEREDDLGAYLLARRALTIDPENDAAGRLATRLEEVLATRGEPVADPLPPRAPSGPRAEDPSASRPATAAPPTAAPSPAASGAPARGASEPMPRRRSLLDRLRGR
jgi:hypothetical protein